MEEDEEGMGTLEAAIVSDCGGDMFEMSLGEMAAMITSLNRHDFGVDVVAELQRTQSLNLREGEKVGGCVHLAPGRPVYLGETSGRLLQQRTPLLFTALGEHEVLRPHSRVLRTELLDQLRLGGALLTTGLLAR